MKLFSKKARADKPQQPTADAAGGAAVRSKEGAITGGVKLKAGSVVGKIIPVKTTHKIKTGGVVKRIIESVRVVVKGGAVLKKKAPVTGEARADHAVDRMVTGLNAARASGIMPKVY
jgi:hypothetical protein